MLVATAGIALSGCTSSSGNDGQAPSMASVRTVLATIATAVRKGDEQAFADALDPRSTDFAAVQRREFTTLARLPFSTWRYVIVGEIRDKAANRLVAQRYKSPVRLVHVTLEYALRGEVQPSPHDQYLVFTQDHGHTYLAGDDALVDESLASWTGPWHDEALIAVPGAKSLVLGPPGDRGALAALAAQIDAAIPRVSDVWGTGWSQRVVAIVPATDEQFTALTGTAVREVTATAVTDGVDSGTGRPYGQRLVVSPTQFTRLSPLGRRIVLTHEITHLATAADTADITPRWVVEGFADYVANLGTGQSVPTAAAELRREVAGGSVPRALPDDKDFAQSPAAVYEQSWLACRLIAGRAGQDGLVRFYRLIGRALAPRAEAVATAFRRVLHEPEKAFDVQWRTYLVDQLT